VKLTKLAEDTAVEVRAWARELGIVSSQRRWSCTIRIETHDKPPARSRDDTRFELTVEALGKPPHTYDHYWVVVWHEKGCFSYSRRAKLGTTHARTLRLSIPTLATILAWLGRVEKKLGIVFRRDRAHVHCSAKGGKRAIEAWLA
jgi:hypothetical protein